MKGVEVGCWRSYNLSPFQPVETYLPLDGELYLIFSLECCICVNASSLESETSKLDILLMIDDEAVLE